MTAETLAIAAGVLLAAAITALAVRPRREYARYDARREVWRFRTSAGTFRAALVHTDRKGRCYIVTARYRDGRTVTSYVAPAEAILRNYVASLTRIYHQERVA